MQLTIRPLDKANEADVQGSLRVQVDSVARDVPDFPQPTLLDFRSRLDHPWPGNRERNLLAERDGEIVATLTVSMPTLDNLHLAELDITVHPDHRRRGVGRALFAHGVAVARDEGRRTVTGNYVTQLPDGPARDAGFAAFAEAMGTKPALPEVRRRLDVGATDRAVWDRLYEEALPQAKGYSPVLWIDGAPDEYVEDVAMLDGRLLLDAPLGDLDIEAEKVDVARVRANEATQRDRGRRSYHAGMRDDATNRLVAWTAITYDIGHPDHAWQQITIVDPTHRGHRLGLIVKIENLRQTLEREPATRVIDTWNAAENSHMIAINETLGYRAIDGWVEWQQAI
jgi:GNAT superfamily N-acetyltransferase